MEKQEILEKVICALICLDKEGDGGIEDAIKHLDNIVFALKDEGYSIN